MVLVERIKEYINSQEIFYFHSSYWLSIWENTRIRVQILELNKRVPVIDLDYYISEFILAGISNTNVGWDATY